MLISDKVILLMEIKIPSVSTNIFIPSAFETIKADMEEKQDKIKIDKIEYYNGLFNLINTQFRLQQKIKDK